MSAENHQPPADILEQTMKALRGVPLSESPPPRFVAETVAALQSYIIPPDLIRLQMPDTREAVKAKSQFTMVGVANLHTKYILKVDYSAKTAETSMVDASEIEKYTSPIKALSSLVDKDAELVGEEKLDGRKTR